MAHTDLILVAALFSWGSVCWLFIMHFGATTVIYKIRCEVFFRHLILEMYARSLFDRVTRVNLMILTFGFLRQTFPKIDLVPHYLSMLMNIWPVVRIY